jgi:hypothetical protein
VCMFGRKCAVHTAQFQLSATFRISFGTSFGTQV